IDTNDRASDAGRGSCRGIGFADEFECCVTIVTAATFLPEFLDVVFLTANQSDCIAARPLRTSPLIGTFAGEAAAAAGDDPLTGIGPDRFRGDLFHVRGSAVGAQPETPIIIAIRVEHVLSSLRSDEPPSQ